MTKHTTKGFTIVELLIVIVVIGILAAITIVSYSGISNKANSTSAQQAAEQIERKADLYRNEATAFGGGGGYYPRTLAALTGATSDKAFQVTGVQPFATTPWNNGTVPTAPNYVQYYLCGIRANGTLTKPAAVADITASLGETGYQVKYYQYTDGTVQTMSRSFAANGATDGANYTYGGSTYVVGCYLSN